MIINKALVHKGSIPLVQMFFSDVSKMTMFQSLNAFTGKSDDECSKICLLTGEQKPNTNGGFSFFSKTDFRQKDFIFCSRCSCSS